MKTLIVISLLAVVFLFLYWRLRPYLLLARRMLGIVREAQRMSVNQTSAEFERPRRAEQHEKLVRCATCGTWTPSSRALSLRSSTLFYCSHECLERAAAPERRTKSAS